MLSPLTKDEKLRIGALMRHDFRGYLGKLGLQATVERTEGGVVLADALTYHLGEVLGAFEAMTGERDLSWLTGPRTLERICSNLLTVADKGDKLTYEVGQSKSIETVEGVLYTALHNLVKNSFEHGASSVEVGIGPFEGEISGFAYNPTGAARGEYARFEVHDNGPGFPPGRPLADYLELGVTSRENGGGFGLFFVKMAAKYLQAPIAIRSEPGNTSVVLYHPLNQRCAQSAVSEAVSCAKL